MKASHKRRLERRIEQACSPLFSPPRNTGCEDSGSSGIRFQPLGTSAARTEARLCTDGLFSTCWPDKLSPGTESFSIMVGTRCSFSDEEGHHHQK